MLPNRKFFTRFITVLSNERIHSSFLINEADTVWPVYMRNPHIWTWLLITNYVLQDPDIRTHFSHFQLSFYIRVRLFRHFHLVSNPKSLFRYEDITNPVVSVVPALSHEGAEHWPVENLLELHKGDQVQITDVPRENGAGVRLRVGQDRHGHHVLLHLGRLRLLPQIGVSLMLEVLAGRIWKGHLQEFGSSLLNSQNAPVIRSWNELTVICFRICPPTMLIGAPFGLRGAQGRPQGIRADLKVGHSSVASEYDT